MQNYQIWRDNTYGEGVVSKPRPHPKGAGSQRSRIFWVPFY